MRGVLIDAPLVTGSATGTEPVAEAVVVPADEVPFDPSLPWQKSPSVALRPEPFGALVYSFSTRKLSFLKSPTLVRVVQGLADHSTASAALTACDVPEAQRATYLRALADLARSNMIEQRTEG